MPGKIFLSLDCEGLWGSCDVLGPKFDAINQTTLFRVYKELAALLMPHGAGATFAITGLFSRPAECFGEYEEHLIRFTPQSAGWYGFVLREWKRRHGEGFHLPEIGDLVCKNPRNKVWQHGLTHMPAGRDVPEDLLIYEYTEAARVLSRLSKYEPGIIFPRNEAASASVLHAVKLGLTRESPEHGINRLIRTFRRLRASTFSSLNPWRRDAQGVVWFFGGSIPLFPPKYSSVAFGLYSDYLARSIAEASQRGETSHIWLHPENIVFHPQLMDFLQTLLRMAPVQDGVSVVSPLTLDF
ncbi:hypothetical protein PE066_00635 [Ramlibacter tataouinensis]|uniref:hypothetical protein n=1 Tax=Ramlibacter tataouinensis TaxID=94132 RepID=UPI0022F3ECE0|nr:hypothetical protein [Ramlibacter tataouinensis]WBY02079.1 hypothetical protein PE066_00635 [Ramlibacter tataouinensis]